MENQMQQGSEYLDTLINLLITWGPKFVGAIIALVVGLYLAG